MSVIDDLKKAAVAVKENGYPWEHAVRNSNFGKTGKEYALLAHPSNVLGLIYDREALDEWMDLCERRAQRMIALSEELDAARTENRGSSKGADYHSRGIARHWCL